MDTIVFIFFVIIKRIIPLFPLRFSQLCAKICALFFYSIIPIRKKVAAANLKLCFPGISGKEINKIVKEAYINVITVIVEFLYFPKLDRDKIISLVNVTNAELIPAKLKEGKGLIIVSAHFGNWELTAYGVSRIINEPLYVIVKEQTNKRIDKSINHIRELHGNRMIDMKQSPREILKLLNENKIVAMLGDQSAPQESSAKVNFFIPDVPMFEGAARIAIKTGAAILFGVSFRNDDGTYSLTLKDFDMSKYKEYNEENVKALTQEHASLLEKAIRERPGHWLWFHRKFKSILDYI